MQNNLNQITLKQLYWNEELSLEKIAGIYCCDSETIRRLMIKFNIPRRKLYRRKYNISKERLDFLYNKKRLSTIEIAKRYGCSQWTIWSLIRKFDLGIRDANDYHKWKWPANQIKPILESSSSISYILAVILGDGWVYKWNHIYSIGLDAKEKEFCESFMRTLSQINLNPCIIKRKGCWRIIASSKLFYKWYKTLDYNKIRNIATKFPLDFLRGFYESEGCLSSFKDKKSKTGKTYNQIIIVNTDNELMKLVKELVENLNFHPTFHKRKSPPPYKPIWALCVSKQKEVTTFLEKVKPIIKNQLKPKTF